MEVDCKPQYGVGRETRSRSTATAMEKLIGKKNDGQDLSSCSKNDHELQSMFNQWAATCGKVYCSDKEREEGFQIFFSIKKFVEEHNIKNRFEALSLNKPADRRACNPPPHDKSPHGCCLPRRDPPKNYVFPDYPEGMNDEELKETRAEFERWVIAQRKVYANEEEREKRFLIFLDNRTMIPSDVMGPDFWEYNKDDYRWDTLDLLFWEYGLPPGWQPCKCDDMCKCQEG